MYVVLWEEEQAYDFSFHFGNWQLSERLLFNANSAIFQLYHGENKLIFNEMMMRSALFLTNKLSWIVIVLAHWNNSPGVDMSLHSDTLFCIRADQSVLFLFNAGCLAENPRSTALEASTLTITPSMRLLALRELRDHNIR
jgi:hypothetical protein